MLNAIYTLMMGVEKVTAFFPHKSPRAFVEIESPLARAFVAFYSMINSIVLFCVTMVICYNYKQICIYRLLSNPCYMSD